MSRPRSAFDLLARSRPARLDPPPDRAEYEARAVSAIVADRAAVTHVRSRPRGTRMLALAAVGATAAVVAVAVAVAGPGLAPRDAPSNAGSGAGTTSEAPVDAGRLLLAAAERTDGAGSAGGRYRTLQTEYGFAVPVDSPGGRYTMIQKSLSQYWLAGPGVGSSWVMTQSLGVAPATPADEAAWRRAGSPAVVRVTAPKPADLPTAPGRVHGNPVDGANLFALGDRNVSQAQLDALPTDPAALRDLLLSTFRGGGGDLPTDRDQWMLGVVAHVVIDLPVSNQVRAAAYRLLATLPGVRALGAVRDVRGRPGQAVAFVQDSPVIGSFEVRLIIDPASGRALGREMRAVQPRGPWSWIAPGALATYQVALVAATTDDNPPKVDVVN